MNVVNIVKNNDNDYKNHEEKDKEESNSDDNLNGKSKSTISFSFKSNSSSINSNSSNNNNSSNQKRKEPEKKQENFITSLEGTKITSSISDEKPLPKPPKVIPLSEQRHINSITEIETSISTTISTTTSTSKSTNTFENIIKTEREEKDKFKRLKSDNNSSSDKNEDDNSNTFKPKQHGLQIIKQKDKNKQKDDNNSSGSNRQEIKSLIGNKKNDDHKDVEMNQVVKVRPLIEKLDGLDRFDNDDDKFKFDVESRPEEADNEDYEETPIEVFGEAMLRGMGWQPGQAIGLTNKGLNEPIQFVKRPGYRLGLGAQPKDVDDKDKRYLVAQKGEDGKVRHMVGISEKLVPMNKSGSQSYNVGERVLVISGQHEGMYAEIDSIPKDSDDKLVIIFKSNERAVINKVDIQLIEKTSNSNSTSSSSSSSKQQQQQPVKSISKSSSSSSNSNNSKSSSSRVDDEPMWLRNNVLVKIVSKSLADGKYYNKKAKVIDIVGEKLCCLELLDSGVVLENIKQRMLETAIPREKGASVCVVQGKHRGRLGSLVERTTNSKRREVAIIQLIGDLSVQEFDLDDICQFIGNRDSEYHT
ncbi:hypothetical protein PPL_02629 [Heterostelium album PN500]|uniref:G-patch domain-containing protein n=1 Tax=Heterostelium pallidum (strain ATCC 26659 / Pp 5 / PN500) TaxID=670386 RepID=D3B2L5_HETP5|nr:hypothetical protein PPL_02629 [Heterostelium album PN500]EFA83563.1 hypothetical protein PPL_02629 [Heterostelium album PN500]|eukprot:XP_020435680.1 hypothetical protein PPL_02629 [Heterostelium album PN500]